MLILLVGALLASGLTRYLTLDELRSHDSEMRSFVTQHRFPALAAFLAIYAVATAASLPVDLALTLAGRYLFGTWFGGGVTVIGATLGAVLVFFAVRTSLGAMLLEKAQRSAAHSNQ